MTTVIADEAVSALLRQAAELTEIRDAQGETLGYFTPLRPQQAPPEAWPTSEEEAELARRAAEPGPRYTTREVFEHLLAQATDPADQEDLRRHIEILKQRDACDSQ